MSMADLWAAPNPQSDHRVLALLALASAVPSVQSVLFSSGHARLGDDELRRPDAQAVADPNLRLEQALGREILAEGSAGNAKSGCARRQ